MDSQSHPSLIVPLPGSRGPRRPPWMRPWQYKAPWVVALVLVLLGASGLLETWEARWRSQLIAVTRAIAPQPPDPNDPSFPVCIILANHGEDETDLIPPAGRTSTDPVEMTARVARVLGAMAALPPADRPTIVGIDLVFPRQDDGTTEYLVAAIRRLGNVVIAASQESTGKGPRWLRSVPPVRDAAAGEGLDIFQIPAWANPSRQARLHAPVRSAMLEGGVVINGFGWEIARRANPDLAIFKVPPASVALHYWNVYTPGETPEEPEGLIGLWPARRAYDYIVACPPWMEGEPPEEWLDRVAAALIVEDDLGFSPAAALSLSGRIALVAAGHPFDLNPTPFTSPFFRSPNRQQGRQPLTPGVVLHATTVATLLKDRMPYDVSRNAPMATLLLMLCGAALGWFMGFRLVGLLLPAGGLGLAMVLVAMDGALFQWAELWLPSMGVALATLGGMVAGTVESTALLNRSRARLTGLLQRFTPPSTMMVMDDSEREYLESMSPRQRQQPVDAWRTAMLIDLAGYTPLMRHFEGRGESGLAAELISDFFSRVIACLDRQGGQVSDLTGDGLAAIFEQETPAEQARAAVRSAREIVSEVRIWRRRVRLVLDQHGGRPSLVPGLRMGIAGSQTQIRFFGSAQQQRSVYFGGAFVLAARIEQIIKKLENPAGPQHVLRVCIERDALAHALEDLAGWERVHEHPATSVQGVEKALLISEIIFLEGEETPPAEGGIAGVSPE